MLPSALAAQSTTPAHHAASVPLWEVFELTLHGPAEGNPFVDVIVSAEFRLGHRSVACDGFYDGNGTYKVRFMPDVEGAWEYVTASNHIELAGKSGRFTVTKPLPGAHGPVVVHNTQHFAHADGAPYFPFGTTSYAWIHQSEALQQQTLATLKAAPFNKIRMCVFPKHYEYNHNEPEFYPFPRNGTVNDFTRFDPRFFAHLEERILDLQRLNIEADVILFHPYDRWCYSSMTPEQDAFYLRYVVARLGAYRNVWWSMANEWDFMKHKTLADFDRLFHVLEAADAHHHLRSIHHATVMYDYSKPWITHASLQTDEFDKTPEWLAAWHKPIVFDEVKYEGNLNRRWGNLSAAAMVRRFWLGVLNGCYVTHGETYLPETDASFNEDSTPTLWWSHGGTLHGESLQGIARLRQLVEQAGSNAGARSGFIVQDKPYYLNATQYSGADGKQAAVILYFMDEHQPVWYEFPLPDHDYTAEVIDTVRNTTTPVPGMHRGKAKLRLPVRPYQAVVFRMG